MGMEHHVGRVGALAVALGIGSAIVGMPGMAWGEPAGATTSASPTQDVDAGSTGGTKTADKPSRGRGNNNIAGSDASAGSTDDETVTSDAPQTPKKKRSGMMRGTAAADTRNDTTASDDATTRDDADEVTKPARVFFRDTPANDKDALASPAPAEGPAAAVEATNFAPDKASVAADVPVAPVPEFATAFTTLFSPRATSRLGDTPQAPAASPLLWTMLAYARRQFGDESSQVGSGATTLSAATADDVQAAAAFSLLPGAAFEAPVVAADGTVYQVTREVTAPGVSSTHVFILDDNAQVLARSRDIDGYPAYGVARPDGTLIVITANQRGSRSTVSAVDSSATVTTIATITGSPDSRVRVGADGALYVSTDVPTFGVMGATRPYRYVRISPTNTVQTLPYNTSVALRPDGSAYLVSSQAGFSTLRVFRPTGATTAISLPYGSDPSEPIVGQDGTVYVTAGVKGLFGGKTTRLYTVTGTSNTVRTVNGLPGDTVVTPDGLYLETFTYPGSSDDGTGTTFISRITVTTVDTSDVINGRIEGFLIQVGPDGTVYAPLRVPSSTTTPVAVVALDGTVTTVTLPGTLQMVGLPVHEDAAAPENVGYVNYSAGGIDHVAVINPDATIARTIDLPAGATAAGVFFGPDGSAYELLNYYGTDEEQTSARQVLAIATTTYTTKVSGTGPRGSGEVVFGPDGIGYLLTGGSTHNASTQILGFDSAGNTVIPLSEFNSLVVIYTELRERRVLTFAPDGTAYVLNNNTDSTASVYALTPSGAQKVLDVDRAPSATSYGPTFTADGTGYVTVGTTTRDTLVHSFSTLTTL